MVSGFFRRWKSESFVGVNILLLFCKEMDSTKFMVGCVKKSDKERQGGIYVHVPVCRRKCLYCDFYSVGEGACRDWPLLGQRLADELRRRKEELANFDTATLYIGGGTPSLMPIDVFTRLLNDVRGIYHDVNPSGGIIETTMEINPDDVKEDRAKGWVEAGVDRVSMGVQCLDDELLKFIGRRHDSCTARRAYATLRKHFSNISLDLMFGLPGQTMDSFKRTVEDFIGMSPEHISAYSLMYEERTALTRMRDSGNLEEVAEDVSVEMFRHLNQRLAVGGYERYEISNYAQPGFESRHNSSYWCGLPYVGIGPSAHSYDGLRTRHWNAADVRSYLAGDVEADKELLTDEELREEYVMTRLRMSRGIELDEFKKKFGQCEFSRLQRESARYIESGQLRVEAGRLFLSERGVMISDEIMSGLM